VKAVLVGRFHIMKRIISKYRSSKFKRFANGLLFAAISAMALALCKLGIIYNQELIIVLMHFCLAILSMTLGFVSMFYES